MLSLFLTAGIHIAFSNWNKPFNPHLGETWQARMPHKPISLTMEQISHHPPISAFYMEGPGVVSQIVMIWQPCLNVHNYVCSWMLPSLAGKHVPPITHTQVHSTYTSHHPHCRSALCWSVTAFHPAVSGGPGLQERCPQGLPTCGVFTPT